MFLQLPVNSRLFLFDLFDQLPVPQAVVDVFQFGERLDLQPQMLAETVGRLLRGLAGGRVERVDIQVRQFRGEFFHLRRAVIVQRDVQAAFNSTLFIKVGAAGTNEHNL